jgi:hypothetical protein
MTVATKFKSLYDEGDIWSMAEFNFLAQKLCNEKKEIVRQGEVFVLFIFKDESKIVAQLSSDFMTDCTVVE